MSDSTNQLRQDLALVARGFFMGGADIVPGVSGGTVALVLGIYERLVTAISHIDLQLLKHVRQGRFQLAAQHIDLRFLVALGAGIASGFLVMSVLMNRLLTNEVTRGLTLAAFFGLIVGSAILVAMMIRPKNAMRALMCLLLGGLAAGGAFWLTTLNNSSHEPTYGYVFLCGCVAICAMILPGISGAMILLIMGIYVHLTEIPHNLLHGEQIAEGLTTSLVFAAGAAISLILFSKLLRWLLARYHMPTMSVLCGFMIGALPKLWPFQVDLTPESHEFKHKDFRPILPETMDLYAVAVLGIIVLAALTVLVVDRLARKKADPSHGGNCRDEPPASVEAAAD